VADDLYAVGVMAYEAVTGRDAFPQDNPLALARAILDDPPPPLRASGIDDAGLAAVIDRAMVRDPAQRFATAAQMRAALAGDRTALFAAGPPAPVRTGTRVLDAPLPGPPTASAPRAAGRARTALVAAGVLVAFAVAIAALAMDPFSDAPATKPISTSTPVPPPPPPSALPPPPPPAGTPAPASLAPIDVQPVQEAAPPKPEKADKGTGNGNGRGGGNGNGKGNGK
jgi:serine/threonine-protein kinase